MALTKEKILTAKKVICAGGYPLLDSTIEKVAKVLAPQQVTLEQLREATKDAGYAFAEVTISNIHRALVGNLSAPAQPSAEPAEYEPVPQQPTGRLESATMIPPDNVGCRCGFHDSDAQCPICSTDGHRNQQPVPGEDEALVKVIMGVDLHAGTLTKWAATEMAKAVSAHFAQKMREALEYRDEDLTAFNAGYTTREGGGSIDGLKAVFAYKLAKALPAERKTPEERVTITLDEMDHIVCVDGVEYCRTYHNDNAEQIRSGKIAQLAAQGGDHADKK